MISVKTADSVASLNGDGGVGKRSGLVECSTKLMLMHLFPYDVEYAVHLCVLPAPESDPLSLIKGIPLMETGTEVNEPGACPLVNGLLQVVAFSATKTSRNFSIRL